MPNSKLTKILAAAGIQIPIGPAAGYVLTSDASGNGSWAPSPGAGVTQLLNVLDVGIPGQSRAGRQLTVADFTTLLGVGTPVGLFNLSNLTTNLGSAGPLVNKAGATTPVQSGVGITGAAGEAASFNGGAGAVPQALYTLDIGPNDPYRIRTGSWGGWIRTATKGASAPLVAKYNAASRGWFVGVFGDFATAIINVGDPNDAMALGVTPVADGRWHFLVATHDGYNLKLYVDGQLDAGVSASGLIVQSASSLCVGCMDASNTLPPSLPLAGGLDEVFATPDVLTEDQIRLLYALKVSHGLAGIPLDIHTSVRRRVRGPLLTQADFTTAPVSGAAPLRLHNLAGGGNTAVVDDSGTQNVDPPTYSFRSYDVAGPDGRFRGALLLDGTSDYVVAADTGLPSGTAARTQGIWFKTTGAAVLNAQQTLMSYGNEGVGLGQSRLYINAGNGGSVGFYDGTTVNASASGDGVLDGQWHLAVATVDPLAADGVKVKVYVDGAVTASGVTIAATALIGANGFRLGRLAAGEYFKGLLSRAFITGYAMSAEQINAIYAKASSALPTSPKSAGSHIEGVDATSVYAIFDTLESQHQVDLRVAA